MNKLELITAIAAQSGLNKTQAGAALDALGDAAQKHLVQPGAELILPGIGRLKSVHRPARTGRHPKTGEDLPIAAKTTVKFVATKALKHAVE